MTNEKVDRRHAVGRLAGAHLAYEVGAPMPPQRDGDRSDGIALGAKRTASQTAEVEAPLVGFRAA